MTLGLKGRMAGWSGPNRLHGNFKAFGAPTQWDRWGRTLYAARPVSRLYKPPKGSVGKPQAGKAVVAMNGPRSAVHQGTVRFSTASVWQSTVSITRSLPAHASRVWAMRRAMF